MPFYQRIYLYKYYIKYCNKCRDVFCIFLIEKRDELERLKQNGLNAVFKPFFWNINMYGKCFLDLYFHLILFLKSLSGANSSNVSVCYIIKIASILVMIILKTPKYIYCTFQALQFSENVRCFQK